jgi:hypothetical protein
MSVQDREVCYRGRGRGTSKKYEWDYKKCAMGEQRVHHET